MVLLTMTAALVAAIKHCDRLEAKLDAHENDDSPSLEDPAVGKPISHTQVIAISKWLTNTEAGKGKEDYNKSVNDSTEYHLDQLLRGSMIYVEPPKPKLEPTSEYKALMSRLRKEEEARQYERMINPPPQVETFSQRFPHAPSTKLFAGGVQTSSAEDEEMTYADINRQMTLIINILISIIACSAAIWMVASHWSTPKRLALSMGGSGMVGIAEIVVYAGYIRRLKEAKEKSKKVVEVKEIMKTWVIGGQDFKTEPNTLESAPSDKQSNGHLRQRKVVAKR
ncbi:hypothetical protein MMC26_002206 [Xylographa opegraphella]|nr:hypothetical protein [Xylographa opegraphella]